MKRQEVKKQEAKKERWAEKRACCLIADDGYRLMAIWYLESGI